MEEQLLKNYKSYLERVNFYKRFGYDIEAERRFILDKSYPLYGDILEVGTGKGYFTVELAKEGHRFTTVDISESDQNMAKLNIRYFGLEKVVDFKIEDAESLSFGNGSFDVIFSINTIHHLASPVKVMDELTRILVFDGKLILSDFTEEGLKVIDKIHAEEGRRHETGKMTLSDVGDYLKTRAFKIRRYESPFQQTIIAYREIV